ncbi:MAG: DUF1501 domain-containing protein [Pyrinomonadaceae bacterium]|nr:DUF1501 domain-containing protein [Pyrinomonadaceae bacterium]
MRHTRRQFLRRAGCALGAATLFTRIEHFAPLSVMAQSGADYRALVCIFLAGGNDGNNLIVPLSSSGYSSYSAARGASGLAIADTSLLPITPSSINEPYGLHPSLPELSTLWSQQKLAVVCNVGPLVQPLTRQQYQGGGVARPYQLFSHSDQIAQWQTARADAVSPTGWGGRTADLFGPNSSGFPMITALSGGSFIQGETAQPLSIAPAPTPLNQVLVLNGFSTGAEEAARRNSMNYLRTIDRDFTLVKAVSDKTQQALDIGQSLNVDPALATPFPNTTLGNQLRQVAKVIKHVQASPSLGVTRQIFFCQLGGFDTHQNQVGTQASLLTQVSQAMKAFYDATVELGAENKVTTFTHSDFGRTLQPAGTGSGVVGSDHAWGNHHFVMGGAVRGGDFYGVPGLDGTVFPTLQLGGPDDTDNRGRWIPTASVEQYAATLATWYGVSASDLPGVFPLIGNFSTPNLGFMM